MPPAGYAYAPMALLRSRRAIALNSKSLSKLCKLAKYCYLHHFTSQLSTPLLNLQSAV
ncbi:MAG: hypothetical protein V7K77_10150 [Nostoc sp.]|uniref:hypothetical protein n=1 Tax=Nostoc sp. TaxID=1180 RepID=UPI002FF64E8E